MSSRAKNSCHAGLFWTPPPTWENPPAYVPRSENNARKSLYHAHYKVPSGDSPYGIAKKVQVNFLSVFFPLFLRDFIWVSGLMFLFTWCDDFAFCVTHLSICWSMNF